MAFVLTALGNAWADDVTVSDIQIPQGKSALLEVSLVNPDYNYRQGLQFNLTLPNGISPDEKAILTTRFKTATVQCNLDAEKTNEETKTWIFVAKSDDNILIANTSSDVVLKVQLYADNGQEMKGYTGTISDIEVTRSVGETLSPFKPEAKTFNITVVPATEFRLVFDENDRETPQYSPGTYNVYMKRTIKADEWSTIVLPFRLSQNNAKAAFGDDVMIAKFTGFDINDYTETDGGVIPNEINVNVSKVTGVLTGGKPYFIKVSSEISEIELNNIQCVKSVAPESFDDDYGNASMFTGSFVPTTIPENGIFFSENKFWYSGGSVSTKAFRGWLELSAILGNKYITDEESRISLTFIDDEQTGIKEHKQYLENGRVYDLQGRRVSKTAKNGLYIKDGKKILVK